MKYLKEGRADSVSYTAISQVKVLQNDLEESGNPSVVCIFACGLGSMKLVGKEMCTAFLDDFESPSSHIIDFMDEALLIGGAENSIERFDANGDKIIF